MINKLKRGRALVLFGQGAADIGRKIARANGPHKEVKAADLADLTSVLVGSPRCLLVIGAPEPGEATDRARSLIVCDGIAVGSGVTPPPHLVFVVDRLDHMLADPYDRRFHFVKLGG